MHSILVMEVAHIGQQRMIALQGTTLTHAWNNRLAVGSLNMIPRNIK